MKRFAVLIKKSVNLATQAFEAIEDQVIIQKNIGGEQPAAIQEVEPESILIESPVNVEAKSRVV